MTDTLPSPVTTIKSALRWAHQMLKPVADNPLREARLLLSKVLNAEPEYLIQYEERTLTIQEAAAFSKMVAERVKGMPVAYLLGQQGFYDIDLEVTPDVLIPRPETELLVEKALAWAADRPHSFIVDVGTGSGAIVLVLAKHLTNAHVTGIDISPAALEVARKNAEKLGLQNRVRWIEGNLLKPMIERREHADLLVANLPYIETAELQQLEVSKHEPILALDGGADGLNSFRELLADAPVVMRPNGLILLEIGANQGQSVSELARQHFPDATISIDKDLAGHNRVISIQL